MLSPTTIIHIVFVALFFGVIYLVIGPPLIVIFALMDLWDEYGPKRKEER